MNTSFVAVPMIVTVVVALVSPEDAPVSVTRAPLVFVSLHPTNVATPLTAGSGFADVQARVGEFADNVTDAALEVTVSPAESSMVATGWAEKNAPVEVVPGT